MKIKILKIIFISSFLLLLTNSAFATLPAGLRVYTSHGEINTLHEAFMKISLIASDGRYIGLCFTILVISFLVTAYNVFGGKGLIGQMGTPDMLQWVLTFLAACVILRAFIIPTTDLTIDDVTTNQTVTIPNVPDGMVLLVNGMNLVENAMLEIVSTAGTPDGFVQNPGGTGFNILSKMFEKQIDLAGIVGGGGTDVSTNLQNYIKDCVAFAIKNNGVGLTLDSLMSNVDYTPILALAANPSVFTSTANGTTLSCSAAYANIAAYTAGLNDAHPDVDAWVGRACAEAAWYDNPWAALPLIGTAKKITCRDNAISFLQLITNEPGLTAAQVFRQILVTQELYRFTTSGDINAGVVSGGSYNQGNSMVSAGLLSAEWMPQIKSMMLAAFLGMSPFLLVFLASTMWKKILGFMFGCLTFFVVWSLCDAVMHDFAMAKALAILRDVAQGKLGYKSVLMFSSDSMKAYAVFGQYRVWSMALAVFFSGALVKGGGELGRIAASRGADMKSTADSAGSDMTDPVKNANKREGLVSAVPTQGIYNSGAYDNMQSVAAHQKNLSVAASNAKMDALGGANRSPEIAANNEAAAMVWNVQKPISEMNASDKMAAILKESRGEYLDKNNIASAADTAGKRNALFERGGTPEGVAQLAESLANFGMSKNLSELGAYQKNANELGTTTDGLLDLVKGREATQAISDGIEFNNSAARHNMSPLSFARKLSKVSTETGFGRAQAIEQFANDHYKGKGGIAAATKDLEMFDRLKKQADIQAFDAISEKFFGGKPYKMMEAISMATSAKAAGNALAEKQVAQKYFGGSMTAMNRAVSLFEGIKKGSELNALGKESSTVASAHGRFNAANGRAVEDYINTVGDKGAVSAVRLEKFNGASRSLMNEIASSSLSGRSLSKDSQRAFDGIKNNEEARAQFNAIGASSGASYTVQKGDDLRKLEKEFGMPLGSVKEGMPLNIKTHMDKNGGVSFDGSVEASTGYNVSRNKNDVSNNRSGQDHTNMLQSVIDLNSEKVKEYAQELSAAKAKGPSALKAAISSQARDLSRDMGSFFSRSGVDTNSSRSSLGINVGGSGGGVSMDSSYREDVNLIANDITTLLNKTVSEGGNLEMSYMKNIGGYVKQKQEAFKKENGMLHGGPSLVTKPIQATKNLFNKEE